jgi:hypothetical protein
MRLFFAILLTACLFSCAPAPHSLKALQRAVGPGEAMQEQVKKKMLPHLWQAEAAAFTWPAYAVPDSTAYRDSIVFANTARAAGVYMRAAWQNGNLAGEDKKERAKIRKQWQR